jgi:vitamin B12 transporter
VVASFLPSPFKTTQNQLSWQNDVDTPCPGRMQAWSVWSKKLTAATQYTITDRTVSSYSYRLNGSGSAQLVQPAPRPELHLAEAPLALRRATVLPSRRSGGVNASYGTSFVAPSFNQLYFILGNANLQLERGRNTDLGVT